MSRKRKHRVEEQEQTRRKSLRARNAKQKEYIKAIHDNDIVICEGLAGTGKTCVAIGVGIHLLDKKVVNKIVIARPVVEAGEDLGYLPGDHNDKLDPYVRPIFDELEQFASVQEINLMKDQKTLEIIPIAFMRGRTFKNSFVLIDECQNAQYDQIKMILTRFGEGSKMVLTGDITQSDLEKNRRGGFQYAYDLFSTYECEGVKCIKFGQEDIVRHKLVGKMIEIWERGL